MSQEGVVLKEIILFKKEREDPPLYKRYLKWIDTAKVQDKYVYYIGNSLSESIIGGVIGKLMMKEAMAGRIYLVQRKIRPYEYEHIAIKASSTPIKSLLPIIVALPMTPSKVQSSGIRGFKYNGEETYR